MCLLNSIQYANSIRIKIVFGKECVLGYVGRQAPNYEAWRIQHFPDSRFQVFQIGHFKGLEIQQNAVKHSVLQQLLRLCSLGPNGQPLI